jgi:PQQ-dependent dehydrogenase (methanol/ethanol family)
MSYQRVFGHSLRALLATSVIGGGVAQAAGLAGAAAEAAREAYGKSCASCHGAGLKNGTFGPPLTGAAFQARWHKNSKALLDYVAKTMPPAAAGSLGTSTYVAATNYVLAANGMPRVTNATPAAAGTGSVRRGGEFGPAVRGFAAPHDNYYSQAVAHQQQKLQALGSVSEAVLAQPPEQDWLMWRRTYDALGFSPLTSVNRSTVKELRSAWNWSLPISQNEITPLVHDGVLFIESGATVQALDAANGDLLWQYVRSLPDELEGGRIWRVKSLALYAESLLVPTADGHLVALDVHTGQVKWDHAVVSAELAARRGRGEAVAFMLDGGPIVAEGRVVIGVSLGQNIAGGCYVVALDAQTGQEVWRFNTIARPGEPAGDSWNGHPLEERFGAGVWTAGSYDPKLHLVYFGTGNTYDTATLLEPNATARPQNAGLYTDTTLALDVRSGKLVWHFQHVNRDVWDLDWVFERSLLTLPVNGVPTDVVVTGGKIAMFDALDRATGRYLFSVDAGLQNLVVAVDPVTGAKQINPDLEPKAGTTALICPNSLGARNWPATAVNPGTHILYVPLIKTCADYAYAPRSPAETAAGGSDIRMAPHPLLDDDGLHAQLAAIDLATRKIVWKKTQRAPFESAILATAGGVIFSGSRDRLFQALDDRTGEVLWETRLNASPSSFPITYTVNGEQYVAIVAGGGGPLDSTGVFSAPEIRNPAEGITLCVFKLPKMP